MPSTQEKKEQIKNSINSIIDDDIKNNKCDHYTEYVIYLSDEVLRSDDINIIDRVYKIIDNSIGLSLSCKDIYEQYELLK